MKYDVIVIGSGPGGYVAAIRASQLGMKAAVVEAGELGGICLNWGCIPTKALLKSAQVYNYMKHADSYGMVLDAPARPDFEAIVRRSRGVAEAMSKGVQFLLKKNNVDVIEGYAQLTADRKVQVFLSDGGEAVHEADHIILATGAHSKELPHIKQDGEKIIGYRMALTLPKLPESMVVMGSGAIGSEFAHFYSTLGTKVTLVEFMPNIVPVEDEEISKQLERCFRKNGVKVMTSSSVESVDTTGEKCKVTIKDGKGKISEVECDVVLSAVGIVANIEGIGLERLGIQTERGKVVVDEYYRTNCPGVYAIGDIVPGPALAHVASHEALVCVEKIAGLNPTPVDYGNIPGCTYTSPEVASVGLTEKKALEAGHELRIGKFPFTASGKATASGNRDGMIKLIFDKNTDEILGCHMVGENVTEMVSGIVVARQQHVKGPELIHAVHPHPTLSEALMEAAAAAYGECVHL
ncbi:MAG: dihydrolipoyl dehydrogenase [Bacteroidales bacterium]|jgi:dihydrolipoamide dehydrogenase|nr:dihydrolipoyl dehydrogenase [Bacteroidales bacterium]